jgi:hypothetical protein
MQVDFGEGERVVAEIVADMKGIGISADARYARLRSGTSPGPSWRRVKAVLGEASSGTPADPTWPGRLADTLQMLREHIRKEQDGVFPAALAGLGIADWEAVEAVRARVGSLLPSPDG